MSAALAAAAAGMAVLLVLPPRAGLGRAIGGSWPRLAAPAAGAGVALTVAWSPRVGALVAICALAVAGGVLLLRRRRRRRSSEATQGRVLEACDQVAAELAAGLPPGRALRRAADAWPALRPVADAFELGGDVPDALGSVAQTPGATDLRLLAAAWAVAHRTGHGLADAVARCADSLRAARATRRLVEGELASARATARLVAALPALALAMGSGTGGDPLGFLLGSPLGLACLAGGLGFGLAGLWWIEAIADDVERAS